MAARGVVFRCANVARTAISRTAQRKTITEGLLNSPQKLQHVRSRLLENNNLMKTSFTRCFSAVVVTQQLCTNPLNLISNVDIRSLAGTASGSMAEVSSEDDEEQNCVAASDVISKVQNEALKSEKSGQVFAVVHIGGRQFKITINDTIVIDRIDAETGDKIRLEKVLLIGGKNFSIVGRPLVERELASIEATVIEKTKAPKVLVFKKKRRKGYKRMKGHRQDITVLKINTIHMNPPVLSTQESVNC